MAIFRKIGYCIDQINAWVEKALYPLLLLLCIVVLLEIVLRSFFTPTVWAYETTQFFFIICSLLCAGNLHREDGHIGVDIIYGRMSPKGKLILDIITFPFFLLFIGSMTYFGFSFAWESLVSMETTGSVWDPVIGPLKLMIPLGALLLLLQAVVNMVRKISKVLQGKDIPVTTPGDLGSY